MRTPIFTEVQTIIQLVIPSNIPLTNERKRNESKFDLTCFGYCVRYLITAWKKNMKIERVSMEKNDSYVYYCYFKSLPSVWQTVNVTFGKFLIIVARATLVWPESTGRYSGSVGATDCGNPGCRNFPSIKSLKTYFIR